MKKILITVAALLLPVMAFSEVKLSYLSGSAAVFHDQKWSEAKQGMLLSEKDKIKTMQDSKAILRVDEHTRVWVRQNTEMEISTGSDGSVLSMLAGKIRARVKLLAGKKFQVKTPVAVCSVRGTEFIISWEGILAVIEGKVNFSDLNFSNNLDVVQGQLSSADDTGKPSEPRAMTAEEVAAEEQEWQGYEGAEDNGTENQGQEKDKEKEAKKENLKDELNDLRMELRDIVGDMRSDIEVTREITNEIKESDISSGRTLRDVHGNIVRVEQHLLRPDNSTIQILNLTKRSDYVYSNRQGWGFAVPNTARLDILDIKIKMNMALPEQITEWPGFIASKDKDLHPQMVEVRMTNQEDEFKVTGDWKPKGSLKEDGKALEEDGLVMNTYINGWKVDAAYDAQEDANALFKEGSDGDGNDKDEMWVWAISPQLKITKDGSTNFVRLYTEAYAINNNGGILTLGGFLSSSDNPFTIMKQVAAEEITFCRKLDGSDFLAKGNLDLVVTPDLALAVAQKLATQMGEFGSSSSSDDNSNNDTADNVNN
ncbi:MAG TPA: hypothetical protein DEE98_03900 [Elusimicrobia bacterium]|nr:MAG: hypothetical protein A2278_01230 [Elusimicrobia bacterium RIFOXYA12_FULL_49_49]OGS15819.1 MAG: hypothetical protein A2251_04130 [Elusimicrobia bacterium RIFOXYA2_FULL_47_53]OGS26007.1 MAG: hypothetical protein A2339_05520 [Elusimicrobia bacterium RIFOXYB12_FULL_50_12]OGS31151.1 MAG: hypothetical protein A2323_08850 [Elusimicrobia bacterium RIFOXYB2_FULL_46_23]HBU69510.1 hypothetical protein [Elusimicrobiota bacterium]